MKHFIENNLTDSGRVHRIFYWDKSSEGSKLYATIKETFEGKIDIKHKTNKLLVLEKVVNDMLEEIKR